MSRKHLTIPRLGSPRVDHGLIEEVRRLRARGHVGEGFYTSDRHGRKVSVKILPDDELYTRMMAAKGCHVRVGKVS
jgi:hypothetical protein